MSSVLYLPGISGKAAEVLTPITCQVIGEVPNWLNGCLYRNGPGIFDMKMKSGKTVTVPHWFDGLTLLHAFEFEDGKVTYRNRYLYPDLEEYLTDHGRLPGSFAGDPCQSVFGAVMARLSSGLRWLAGGRTSTSANIGVTIGRIQGSRLVSKTDFNGLVEVEPESLAPKPMFSYTDINPAFKGFLSAAHGQYDIHTKQYFNYTLDFPRGSPTYNIFCIPDDDPKGYLLTRLHADAAYIHSFAMTERFLVFIVWPAVLSMLRLVLVGAPAPAMSWQPEKGAMMYVIDKNKGGRGHVATYRAPAFFCFHTINSFEEGDSLHVDLCGYDDLSLLNELYLEKLRSGQPGPSPGTIRRYSLPGLDAAIASGPRAVHAAEMKVLCDGQGKGAEVFDLPRFNVSRSMQQYSYVYSAIKTSSTSGFFDGLAKVDVRSGKLVTWSQEGHFPGEPVFLPSPKPSSEDDGVLLSVVLHGSEARSYLLILDARSMREVGRAEVGQAVPFGFHGNFFARDLTLTTQLD